MSDLIIYSLFGLGILILCLIINLIRWLITGNWWLEEDL